MRNYIFFVNFAIQRVLAIPVALGSAKLILCGNQSLLFKCFGFACVNRTNINGLNHKLVDRSNCVVYNDQLPLQKINI